MLNISSLIGRVKSLGYAAFYFKQGIYSSKILLILKTVGGTASLRYNGFISDSHTFEGTKAAT